MFTRCEGGGWVEVDIFFARAFEDAAGARVCVLDVVVGVVFAVRDGEVKVEVEVLFGFAHDVVEARGVGADLGAQVAQGDELAGAGGHLDFFAVLVEHGELHQGDVEFFGVKAEGGE